MRQVIGKATRDLDAAEFDQIRASYKHLIVDLGTGDGKHVLHVARQRPDALVIGIDASPDAMVKSSARAAAKPARGGMPNAIFVRAAVERLPDELRGVSELHCLMPWGSLLRALAMPDADVLTSVAERCTQDAPFLVTFNLHAWRPSVADVGDTEEPTPESAQGRLAEAYAASGWVIEQARYDADLTGLGTSWTKRLGSSRDELAVLALHGRIGGQNDPSTTG